MDEVIAAKHAAIDQILDDLVHNFVDKFWEQLQEVYVHVHHHQRQSLVWKALHKKDKFLAGIKALRQELISSLAETRSQLVSELNSERTGLAEFVGARNSDLVS